MLKSYDLEERLVNFAAEITLFFKTIPNDLTGPYHGNQPLYSGGGSALNFGEMQGPIGQRLLK